MDDKGIPTWINLAASPDGGAGRGLRRVSRRRQRPLTNMGARNGPHADRSTWGPEWPPRPDARRAPGNRGLLEILRQAVRLELLTWTFTAVAAATVR